jgi:hypothetical protein
MLKLIRDYILQQEKRFLLFRSWIVAHYPSCPLPIHYQFIIRSTGTPVSQLRPEAGSLNRFVPWGVVAASTSGH